MLGLFFGEGPVRDFADAKRTGHRLYPRFHRAMLESGIYLPPSPFETIFLSTAHAVSDIAGDREGRQEGIQGGRVRWARR